MIYVCIEGYDFKYEIHDTLRIFFGEKEIKYIEKLDKEPPFDSKGAFLLCSISQWEGSLLLEIKLSDGKYVYNKRVPIGDVPEGDKQIEKLRKARKEIKRQVYIALADYTGISAPWGVLTGVRPVKIAMELLERGIKREEAVSELKEHYLISEEKAELLLDIAHTEREILKKADSDTISLYIGIPFCPSRCLYCSFTSYSINGYRHLTDSYLQTLKSELLAVKDIIKEKAYRIQSIYIGGGTPTSLDEASLRELLSFIEYNFDLSSLEEFTVEAGRPDSIDFDKLKAIKSSRVNRISINPQTMNNSVLETIGRKHTASDVIQAFSLARELGFENINMDIIAGLPGESVEMFENTLMEISRLKPESLTVHTMAVKRASRLKESIDQYSFTAESDVSRMVKMAQDYALSMGMHPYYLYRQKDMLGKLENIGYCKPGFESIYNILIMEERQTIIAVGAGAVTKVVYPEDNRIERAFNVKDVEEYIRRVDEMVERKRALL